MDGSRKSEGGEQPSSIAGSVNAADSQENLHEKGPDSERSSLDLHSPTFSMKNEVLTTDFKPEVDVESVPGLPRGETDSMKLDGEEEDPSVPVSFQRSSSPTMQKNKGAAYGKVGEDGINRMHKFSLYETSTRFYLVGADIMDKHYRVLKIDRTAPPGHLNIFEDDIVYDKREMNLLLNAIDDGNKGTGGMKLKCSTWGLLGFIRFTEAYYMLLITKRLQVAMVGGHYIYQVDGTELIPLTTGSTSRFQKDRNPEEARFLSILNNLDFTRYFYFSYSYNITRSLQQNIIRERMAMNAGRPHPNRDTQDMFVWNHYLLEPARETLKNVYDWCHPVIHGYIDQASIDVFGRRVFITIFARRSRFFAGARFLKRGANDLGYVANDVETEQIVSEALNTSFHAPGPRLYANPTYTSYVQHRGSIPLYWTQDATGVTPKPDIDLNLVDPFYSPAALHFDHLFERYGAPIYVLNLIKARERTPRESKLLFEYKRALDYLNQSLPKEKRIIYDHFDMARASKTRGGDVIGTLEHRAEKILRHTGFFHNGDAEYDTPQVQNGVARTNCIDCLDRTNAAQFVIGKRALGRQLHALGVISGNTVEYDTDCVDIFTHMFHGHGDAIAIQYGGSHLVNTMATYRKINQWQSSSRDMVESFKRYYHNSFLDSQRQEAYNLFLGNYVFTHGQPMLWDLPTDYYLHHEDPRSWLDKPRRGYIHWYTPEYLEPRYLPPSTVTLKQQQEIAANGVAPHDDYWLEYYRPLAISSFLKIFAFRLNCPPKEVKDNSYPSRKDDMSPFVIRRKQHDHESPSKGSKKPGRSVTIVDPSSDTESRRNSIMARRRRLHLSIPESPSPVKHSILRDPHFETTPSSAPATTGALSSLTNSTSTGLTGSLNPNFKPADKTLINQWTLTQFYENSLNPSVSTGEEDEYARYIEHPLQLPLVVSSETPSAEDPSALEFYEYLCMDERGLQNLHLRDASTELDGVEMRSTTADLPRLDTDAASIRSNFSMRPTSAAGLSVNIPFSHAPSHPMHPHPHHPHHSHTHHNHTAFATQPYSMHLQPPSHHYSSYYNHNSSHSDPGPTLASGTTKFQTPTEDVEEFEEFLCVKENPLDVEEEDGGKKRYKAYRQWLKGKSFFKQSKVDPEWQNQLPVR